MTNHNGKAYIYVCVCVCVTESLSCAAERTHCKSVILQYNFWVKKIRKFHIVFQGKKIRIFLGLPPVSIKSGKTFCTYGQHSPRQNHHEHKTLSQTRGSESNVMTKFNVESGTGSTVQKKGGGVVFMGKLVKSKQNLKFSNSNRPKLGVFVVTAVSKGCQLLMLRGN